MALLDDGRRHVDVNGAMIGLLGHPRSAMIGRPAWEFVVGGPIATEQEWQAMLDGPDFTGQADLRRSDGGRVTVQFAAHPEVITGRRLMLFVALQTSRREIEIVGMVAQGATSAEIADALHLSNNTVRTHVRNAMVKLDVRSRAQLVAKAMGEGLVLS
jgi:DNA-binding CsgD family transcriptional regulator